MEVGFGGLDRCSEHPDKFCRNDEISKRWENESFSSPKKEFESMNISDFDESKQTDDSIKKTMRCKAILIRSTNKKNSCISDKA